MNYANMLEERSPERLEYLIKADKEYRGIIDDDTKQPHQQLCPDQNPQSLRYWFEKQLAAINPDKYSIDTEILEFERAFQPF